MSDTKLPKHLLDEFNNIYMNHNNESVVNIDKKIKTPFDCQIQRFEDAVGVFKGSIPPNRFSHYYVALVTHGSGIKSIGLTTFEVKPQTLILQPSGVVNSSRGFNAETNGYIVSFSSNFLLINYSDKNFLNNIPFFQNGSQPYLYISAEEQQILSEVFERIIGEYSHYQETKEELIRFYIFELIYKVKRLYNNVLGETHDSSNVASRLVNEFKKLVEQYYAEKKQVAFYAEKLHLHPNHLNATIKSMTGKTCSEWLQGRILLEAKCQLKSSSLSVKEIALTLKFDDAAYFSKYFKKNTGLSPLEYRKSNII